MTTKDHMQVMKRWGKTGYSIEQKKFVNGFEDLIDKQKNAGVVYICNKCGQEMEVLITHKEVYVSERIALQRPNDEYVTNYKPTKIDSAYVFSEIRNIQSLHEARVNYWYNATHIMYACKPCNRKCTTDGKVYNLTTGEEIIEL